jgi:hypothetical protein
MNMASGPSRSQPEALPARPARGQDVQEVKGKATDFKDRLEKLSKGSSQQPEAQQKAAEDPNQQRGDIGPVKGWNDGEQSSGDRQEGQSEGFGLSTAAQDFVRNIALAKVAPAQEIPSEQLARIIAAIEELADIGANAEYQLSLPAGPTAIEGAVLGRDPTGKLNIQLIANAPIPAAALQQLQTALRQKLMDRKAQLGKLDISVAGKR